MAYKPRFSHLVKILFGLQDPAAAEGLFMEGQIEFESGNKEEAELMFYFGKKLNKRFAGNYYNYAVAVEKTKGPCKKALAAWKEYLGVAPHDPKQPLETQERVRQHVQQLQATLAQR